MRCSWYIDVMDPATGDHLGNVRCESFTETGSLQEHDAHHGPMIATRAELDKLRKAGR